MNDKLLERYIKLKDEINVLTKELDDIKKSIIDGWFDWSQIIGDKKITKTITYTPKLNPLIDVWIILELFPQAVKPDVKILKNIPSAHKYLDVSEINTLRITTVKKKEESF